MKELAATTTREWRQTLLFFIAVTAIVMWPLWQGHFYAVGDMRDVTIPLEIFFHNELLAGRLPAWHPDISWGFPVIASAQIGFFYPLLLLARLLPIWLYLPLTLVVHELALFCGTYLFLRRKVPHEAALVGSLAFGLSAFLWQHLTHLNIFLSEAWLPWQLVAADYVITGGCRRRKLGWLAIALGLPFLVGQLQVPLLQALFVTAYLLTHLRQSWLAKICRIAGVAFVVALLASAQVVPTLELLSFSSRGNEGDFDVVRANQHSFPLYHVPTTVFPRFFGNDHTYWGKRLEIEYGIFIGTLPLLFAIWATIYYVRQRERYPEVAFWVYAAIVSFLLALGSASPLRWLGLEPSLWFFSAPARWLLFTSFSGSMLAAYGVGLAQRNLTAFTRFVWRIMVLIAVVVVAANVAIAYAPQLLTIGVAYLSDNLPHVLAGRESNYYQEKVGSLLLSFIHSSVSWRSLFTYLPFAAALGGLLTLRRHRLGAMVGITTLELLIVAATTTPAVSWRNILSPPDTIAALPQNVLQKQARIISLQPEGDTGAYFTNPASRPDRVGREQQRQLLLPLMSAQYGLAGIQWPASLDIQKQADVLASLQAGSPATVDLAQAAQRTVGAVLLPVSLGSLPASLHGVVNDIAVYTLPAVPRATLYQGDGNSIPVNVRDLTPGHTQLTVDSPCDCELTVRDSWYPGWKAFIDGAPLDITPAEDIFRKLRLSPGTHTIDMIYQPKRMYVGMVLSVIGLLIILFLLRPSRVRVNG